jgi:hypothetical protein
MPDELREGLADLQDAFWECGVDALLSQTDEADDLIATLASGIAQHGASATIISTDKGFCQLICPQIRVRDYFNKRWLDAAFVQQQYGVTPTQLVDFWALTGISGSNIKGCPALAPRPPPSCCSNTGTWLPCWRPVSRRRPPGPAQAAPAPGRGPAGPTPGPAAAISRSGSTCGRSATLRP